jgi:hypothetical protein
MKIKRAGKILHRMMRTVAVDLTNETNNKGKTV